LKQHGRSAIAVIVSSCLFLFPLASEVPARQQQIHPPASQGPQQSSEESPNELFVTVGKSVIVNSSVPIERVSVGFGDTAEATVVGPTEVLVNGKAPGETSLIIWQQGGGKLFFDILVQPSRFVTNGRTDILRRQIARELPGQKIDVSVENDLIFLRGTARNLTSANRAMAIASAMGKPVDLLYVDVPAPEAQILLKVRFASVDRSLLRQLGMNLFSTGATNTIGSVTTQQFSAPALSTSGTSSSTGGVGSNGVTATISNFLNLFFFRPDLNLGATIEALQQRGVVETLAEPNVLAENGKEASFLAGGEFPYPVVQGGSTGGTTAITIQFREFGVRLNFIPTITPRGSIKLQVAPEVSALDYANGITIQGFTVPGVSVRNVNTEVELAEGQSFAIGGLLDNRETETFSKIPFIGDIPVLGKFFQSKTKNRTNTELMVIVTPQIVRPAPAGQQIAGPKFPVPFLPPNTGKEMATPGQNVTGPVPVTPPTPSVPVESLIQSLVEKPLVVTSTTSGGGYGGSGQGAAMGTTGPAGQGAGASAAPVTPP
jgi:pilus assembly protein CpaC